MTELHPGLKIRLYTDEKCFGPGVARLLQGVDRLHSLRAAASELDMAYSKAWKVIKSCEQNLGFPLLLPQTGGQHGGGTSLTPEARKMLDAYLRYAEALQKESDRLFHQEFDNLL